MRQRQPHGAELLPSRRLVVDDFAADVEVRNGVAEIKCRSGLLDQEARRNGYEDTSSQCNPDGFFTAETQRRREKTEKTLLFSASLRLSGNFAHNGRDTEVSGLYGGRAVVASCSLCVKRTASQNSLLIEMHQFFEQAIARVDFLARQRLQTLGAELLDAKAAHHRSVDHGAAHFFLAGLLATGERSHESAGEGVAGAGGIDHFIQRIRGRAKNFSVAI